MKKARFFVVVALAVAAMALAPAAPAQAAHPKKHAAEVPQAAAPASQSLGTFDLWAAYEARDKTGRVCYLVGQPRKSEPAKAARNAPVAMVTHRPAENIANVVSFVEGYPLQEGSSVALDIGPRKFELFTNGDSAWARTSELDSTIVTTLAKSTEAVVKGTPSKGPATTDVYSLAGFSKALAAIDKACGIKRAATVAPRHPAQPHRANHPKPGVHRVARHS